MARQKPSEVASPAKNGKEHESNEVCMRHDGVTLCGNRDDVKKIMSLLEKQESEHSVAALTNAAVAASSSDDDSGDSFSPPAPSKDAQPDDVSSRDAAADNYCSCS